MNAKGWLENAALVVIGVMLGLAMRQAREEERKKSRKPAAVAAVRG